MGTEDPFAGIDRAWDAAMVWLRRHRLRDVVVGASAVLYLAVRAASTALDSGIKKIHALGVNGVSTNSLHNGRDAIEHAFTTWAAGDERLSTLLDRGPVYLGSIQTWVELALVLPTFLIFYGILKCIRAKVANSRPVHRVMVLATMGLFAYVALGVVNQVAELMILAHHGPISGLDTVLFYSSKIRSISPLLVLAPIVIGVIQINRDERSVADDARVIWWHGIFSTYRVLILVAVMHAALFLFSIPGAQSEDALRLWLRTPSLGVTGLLGTVVLSFTLGALALRIGTNARPQRKRLGRRGTWIVFAIGAVTLGIGLLARIAHWSWNAGAVAAGALIASIALLSVPLIPRHGAGDSDESVAESGRPIAEPSDRAKRIVPAVLAAAPLVTLTMALVRASVPSIIGAHSSGWLLVYAGVAIALSVAAFCLALWASRRGVARPRDETSRRPRFVSGFALQMVLVGLAAAAVYGFVINDPYRFGPDLGVPAIVAVFLVATVVVLGTLGYSLESRAVPAALDFVGFRRLPVVLLLIGWGLLSSAWDNPGYHDLPTVKTAMPAQPQVTIETELARWEAANLPDAAVVSEPGQDRPAVPLVFVAAAGGGLKAATFTAAAIDCIFMGINGQRTVSRPESSAVADNCNATHEGWSRLFAASGASGGSVGIASVVAERAVGPTTGWVSDRLGQDLLSPELAWQLFVEVPNAFVNFNPRLDRSEALQQTWRDQFTKHSSDAGKDPGGAAYYTDQSAAAWTDPVLFLSGTNLNDGCRVNISTVRSADPGSTGDGTTGDGSTVQGERPLAPADETRAGACKDQRAVLKNADGSSRNAAPDQADTRDLVDFLCGKNIDLATAAFLSARFPFVSSTGTIRVPEMTDGRCTGADPETTDSLSIGDAGYRDNSGAASIMDSWSVLAPMVDQYNATHDRCIVPMFVEINTGYDGFGALDSGSDVAQLLAPLRGAAKVFSDLSYGPIEQAAAEFSRTMSPGLRVYSGDDELDSRFFRVGLVDHPGVTAPLGWSLSGAAASDLGGQLNLAENQAALASLKAIVSPTGSPPLTCHSVAQPEK